MSTPLVPTPVPPRSYLAQDAFKFWESHLEGSGNYLEIGSFNGDFVARLARQHPSKIFYCVDPFVEDGNTSHCTHVIAGQPITAIEEKFWENTKGLSNVALFREQSKHFYACRTQEELTALRVEYVFVDGNHRFDHIVNDLYLAVDLIRWVPDGGGLIYVDDTNTPDVQDALKRFEVTFRGRVWDIRQVGKSGMTYRVRAQR